MSRGLLRLIPFLALALPVAVGHAEDATPRPGLPRFPARTKEFQSRVNRAIDRGVAWLKTRQQADGGFRRDPRWGEGQTPLAVLTLRACGVPGTDPSIVSGMENLRRCFSTRDSGTLPPDTYGVSLVLLALEAHYDPGPAGIRAIPEADKAWASGLVKFLERSQAPEGGFGYGAVRTAPGTWSSRVFGGDYWDNSNSQYAVLGLGAARLLGVSTNPEVWRKALRHWIATQQNKGEPADVYQDWGVDGEGYGQTSLRRLRRGRARGWSYRGGDWDPEYKIAVGSLTSGGVSSIALCRDALAGLRALEPELEKESALALTDGIAWLGKYFSVKGNPSGFHMGFDYPFFYYYLYGLERAGVLAGTAWMGRHDWYLEGATYLIEAQRPDGSWNELAGRPSGVWSGIDPMPQVDTCFALLFLKRATSRLRAPTTATGGVATSTADEGLDPSRGPGLDEKAFADLFAAVFRRYAATPLPGRAGRAVDFVRMGTRSIRLLILRLDSEDADTRGIAAQVLGSVTVGGPSPNPAADSAGWSAVVEAWEAWWMARKDRLSPDVAVGRFVEGSGPRPADSPSK